MALENVNTEQASSVISFFKTSLTIILSVTFIVLFMPNTEKPRLTYELGNPWTSPQLISPGEILIKKDPKILEQEQNEAIKNEYIPYYSISHSIAETQINAFRKQYEKGIPGISAYCIQSLADIMSQMYEQGIMAQDDYTSLIDNDTLSQILVIDNNIATKKQVKECLSVKKAYENLFKDKRVEKEKALLMQYNLNEFIVPNVIFDADRSEQSKHDILATIPTNSGIIKPGQEIINRGDIITEEKGKMIDSYNDFIDVQSSNSTLNILRTNGIQWLYVMTLFLLMML